MSDAGCGYDIGQQGAQYTAYTQLVTASIGTSTSNLQLLVIYTLFLDRELWLQAAAVRLFEVETEEILALVQEQAEKDEGKKVVDLWNFDHES